MMSGMSPTIKEDRHEEVYREAGSRGTRSIDTSGQHRQSRGVSQMNKAMDYLPLFFNLRGRRVLVVGGDEAAVRKILGDVT